MDVMLRVGTGEIPLFFVQLTAPRCTGNGMMMQSAGTQRLGLQIGIMIVTEKKMLRRAKKTQTIGVKNQKQSMNALRRVQGHALIITG